MYMCFYTVIFAKMDVNSMELYKKEIESHPNVQFLWMFPNVFFKGYTCDIRGINIPT